MRTQSGFIIIGSLYTIAMVLVFLLLMFPYDGLQTRLIYTLSGFFPFQLRAMGTYEVVPPLGIAWSDVKMQGLDRLSMPWRRMELVLDSVSALKGKPQLKLTMESYAGLSTSSGKAEPLVDSFILARIRTWAVIGFMSRAIRSLPSVMWMIAPSARPLG